MTNKCNETIKELQLEVKALRTEIEEIKKSRTVFCKCNTAPDIKIPIRINGQELSDMAINSEERYLANRYKGQAV